MLHHHAWVSYFPLAFPLKLMNLTPPSLLPRRFMSSVDDDVRLPFSTLDPMIGDVFTALWEPEMMAEMGNALKILTTEVLSTVGQTVLQATVMTALVSALQWPLSSFSLFLSAFPSIIRSDLAFLFIPFSPHEAQLPHR